MGAPGDILPSPCTSVEGVRCLAGAPGNILPSSYTSVEVVLGAGVYGVMLVLTRELSRADLKRK